MRHGCQFRLMFSTHGWLLSQIRQTAVSRDATDRNGEAGIKHRVNNSVLLMHLRFYCRACAYVSLLLLPVLVAFREKLNREFDTRRNLSCIKYNVIGVVRHAIRLECFFFIDGER